MMELNAQQRRVAAWAILVPIVLLTIAAVALPVWLFNRHYDVAIENATSNLARYSKIIGMRDALQKQAIEVKNLEANHHFLKSASPALAAAELQQLAQGIFDANSAKVNSTSVLPHKDEGAYRQVSVSVQLVAPLSAIKAMLYAIESAHPYLFLDNFSIRAPNMVVSRSESGTESELVVQFDLSGYALKGAL
jgi:general secretion pathway protein M